MEAYQTKEPYTIKIDAFEGPFDLLFHLIEKNKIDIYDIPISLVADQYLDYIAAMQELDLDVASEFLVMASTLLHIKSRLMLPPPARAEGEDGDGDADPRAALVVSMIEYKRYKEFGATLREQAAYWGEAHYRPGGLVAVGPGAGSGFFGAAGGDGGAMSGGDGIVFGGSGGSLIADGVYDADGAGAADGIRIGVGYEFRPDANRQLSLFDMDRDRLFHVYRRLLEENRRSHEDVGAKVGKIIERDQVPIALKIREILRCLVERPRFLFQRFFDPKKQTRRAVVTAFLAILELSRQNRVRLRQKKLFGGLLVSRRMDGVDESSN
ncbi:MAG: segregation/condensation protein A [Clostridiales bacterium]|jgi:chromatin segregation and condensation protein Rec8/ScpA/Scc1 (kleisin family)|nr:segregation/condensation protein A [Clostridiales bacterium]